MPVRVLLAEDSPTVRASVRSLLEREHYDVVGEAADGQEAVALAEQLAPALVILDLSMPRMTGLEAARRISAALPSACLIALTRHTDSAYVQSALQSGFRGYVNKSDAPEDLLPAIAAVCRGGTFLSARASQQLTHP